MKTLSALLVISFYYLGYSNDAVTKQTFESFDVLLHENKGCPINSYCSKSSGKKLKTWEDLIENITEKNKISKLKSYQKKHGFPLQFLTTEKAKEKLDPIMWKSRCDLHNPRNPNSRISRALSFFKKIPNSELTKFVPVRVYDGGSKVDYKMPYQDQVNFLKDGKIVLLKEYDDFFYQIAIDPKGEITVVNHSYQLINLAMDKKVAETKCPAPLKIDETFFAKSYCQKILDLDTNDLKIIQYAWSCP